MRRTDSLEKTLMLGKIEGRRRRGRQRWDGWMASPRQWTWVWAGSGSWWWTGKSGCCSPWGHEELDTTEWLNWTDPLCSGQQRWKTREFGAYLMAHQEAQFQAYKDSDSVSGSFLPSKKCKASFPKSSILKNTSTEICLYYSSTNNIKSNKC